MRMLLLLTIVAVAFANQECGENAHYEECGTACPLTCKNFINPPKMCVLRCDSGCQCNKGYVKTTDGRCVLPIQCPADEIGSQCGEHAHFESCGTACPLTCENYDDPPKICVLRCDIGCHCDAGYVKTADGRCVKPENCPSRAQPVEENCFDEPQKGMCLAYIPMWNYDAFTQKCHEFIYGGCGGNGNRYKTEEECMQKCQDIVAEEETDTDPCDLPAETGVCRGFFPRYYFDRTTGQCQKFVYGGCGGNENNFETIEECQKTCTNAAPSACLEEKVVGPCKAAFRRFYHNKKTGKCEEFIYGGCRGNSNNFLSQEDCEAVCKA